MTTLCTRCEGEVHATTDALIAANNALVVLLAGITKERDLLKGTMRKARKQIIEGTVPEIVLQTLDLYQLAGYPL